MVKLHYFRNQRYDKLKSLCVKEKKLFEDPEFPPEDKSLFFSRSPTEAVEWKRPKVCLNVLLQNMFSSIVNRPLYQPFPSDTNQLDVSLFVRLHAKYVSLVLHEDDSNIKHRGAGHRVTTKLRKIIYCNWN